MKQPVVYMLIGVPASGKSTWIANQPFDWNRTVVASTDNYIERAAKDQGKTYNDVFKQTAGPAAEHMAKTVADAVKKGYDIIWDQTNTSAKSRAGKLKTIPNTYKKVAVVFGTPDDAEHARRLNSRPGKNIPPEVIASMKKNLQLPTKEEGFDEIWNT